MNMKGEAQFDPKIEIGVFLNHWADAADCKWKRNAALDTHKI